MPLAGFTIGSRKVGHGEPAFLIAEVAQAHDGSLGTAHAYIDLAKEAGADAVKFQTHIADAETTPLEDFRVRAFPQDATRFEYWQRMQFTPEQWSGLADHARDKGLIFLSSPFSQEALELLDRLGVPAWKVASGEVSNDGLLAAMCRTGKPILLSSGMSDFEELSAAVSLLRSHGAPFGVFQCTSRYPTPLEEVGLNVLADLEQTFDCVTGLSDHSGTPYPALAAIALGAGMIELHLAFHRLQFGPDTVASLTADEFQLISHARDAFHIMATRAVDKKAMADELQDMRRLFNKSVALRDDQKAGTILTQEMLTAKKPGTGIPAGRLPDLVGRQLVRDVSARELLDESDFG